MNSASKKFADWVVQDMAITGRTQKDAIAMIGLEESFDEITTAVMRTFHIETATVNPQIARAVASQLSKSFGVASQPDSEEDREWKTPHVKPEKKAKALARAIK